MGRSTRGSKRAEKSDNSGHDTAQAKSELSGNEVEAILLGRTKIPDTTDDVQEFCTDYLVEESANATISYDTEPPRWGNTAGLSTLERLDLLEDRVRQMEQKVMCIVKFKDSPANS